MRNVRKRRKPLSMVVLSVITGARIKRNSQAAQIFNLPYQNCILARRLSIAAISSSRYKSAIKRVEIYLRYGNSRPHILSARVAGRAGNPANPMMRDENWVVMPANIRHAAEGWPERPADLRSSGFCDLSLLGRGSNYRRVRLIGVLRRGKLARQAGVGKLPRSGGEGRAADWQNLCAASAG